MSVLQALEETVFKIPYVNFKPFINEYISDKWQTIWNGAKFDKLREVGPIVKRPRVIHKLSRREEIVLARLRIGHTRITHSHLLKREDQPKCIGCDTPFTVKHFLLECTDFAAERISCFQANNLKELFKDVLLNRQSYYFIYRFFTTTFISYLVLLFDTSSIYFNVFTLLDANDPSGLMRR